MASCLLARTYAFEEEEAEAAEIPTPNLYLNNLRQITGIVTEVSYDIYTIFVRKM